MCLYFGPRITNLLTHRCNKLIVMHLESASLVVTCIFLYALDTLLYVVSPNVSAVHSKMSFQLTEIQPPIVSHR